MKGNWGRWGDEDERGALNLTDATRVMAAVATVARGLVLPLAQPLSTATETSIGRPGLSHHMLRDGGDYLAGGKVLGRSRFAEDSVALSTHLGTHVDSFAHLWYDEQLYNGHPQNSVRSSGAHRCGIEKMGPLVGRGVLLDLAAQAGEERLSAGTAIGAERLEACRAAAGIELQPGDIVLLRTGWMAQAGDGYFDGEPGIDLSGGAWLAERDVAVVGADNYAVEALSASGADRGFPVHELLLRDCGVPLIENLELEALAAEQAGPFLFSACPLPLRGATASPLSPVAIL